MDTGPEPRYDELIELAAFLAHTPMAAISFINEDRQWFKSTIGFSLVSTTRATSFCGHTLAASSTMVVGDTLADSRFADNPFVIDDPLVRFYAGVPLTVDNGQHIGSLCVMDTRPRTFLSDERRALEILARQAVAQLEVQRYRADGSN